jgi:LmbE family N-acetylglucosaminyl deacetylase
MTGHGEGAAHPLWPRSVWVQVREEARSAASELGLHELLFEELPAVLVSQQPLWSLNSTTSKIVERICPDVLYVPFPFDLHADHRAIFHSLSVAWRPCSPVGRSIKEIHCYEVPSETHWNAPYLEPGFLPSLWVDISTTLETKLRALACYKSQLRPAPDARSLEAIRALAVWRGSQMSMAAAESFVTIRCLW